MKELSALFRRLILSFSLKRLSTKEFFLWVCYGACSLITGSVWQKTRAQMIHHGKMFVAVNVLCSLAAAIHRLTFGIVALYLALNVALYPFGYHYDARPIISYLSKEIKGQPQSTCMDKLTDGTWRQYPKCIEIFTRGSNQDSRNEI